MTNLVIGIGIIMLLLAWEGVAVSFLWNGFIVPLAPHIALIGIREGIAISALASVLTFSYKPRSKEETLRAVVWNIVNTGFALLVGWILLRI